MIKRKQVVQNLTFQQLVIYLHCGLGIQYVCRLEECMVIHTYIHMCRIFVQLWDSAQ